MVVGRGYHVVCRGLWINRSWVVLGTRSWVVGREIGQFLHLQGLRHALLRRQIPLATMNDYFGSCSMRSFKTFRTMTQGVLTPQAGALTWLIQILVRYRRCLEIVLFIVSRHVNSISKTLRGHVIDHALNSRKVSVDGKQCHFICLNFRAIRQKIP